MCLYLYVCGCVLRISLLFTGIIILKVLAVFDDIHVNRQLHVLVFGESLLNGTKSTMAYTSGKNKSQKLVGRFCKIGYFVGY